MKTLIHPFAAKLTEDEVIANRAFPLVRELNHKYGLMVLAAKYHPDSGANSLFMAREDGMPVCKVFFMADREAFAIRNCMANKDRGRSTEDKLTFFGKKVSFVMKVIEKEGLIPTNTENFIRRVFGDKIRYGVDSFSEAFGEVRKSNHFSGEITHQLIEIALGNQIGRAHV